ncbi:putative signaling protein [Actinoplanes sp. SE50]|uniref:MHYT domain-containing protein n=1 Tax=unclassified Actinoplanes TaxID=2626549 RepID=UPI00023ECFC6|nr:MULTISPECIES: MHYT domain-containing protein [unclassified Actinoplanes]AEV82134.1 putative signaling protein [Actinoplanes sp. SE50/110]ATO80533.1 putative signaling protein [Actinoplanes sp. SE50]SLL97939.1 putative signaling protein [Actinoplanes sp. SE50/110]
MAEIHHFDHGWVTPAFSYLLSVLGSLLGLTGAVRLRSARTRAERGWWLVLAALAIGTTGIWTMHFVAMLGFEVVGTPIRYDVNLTVASVVMSFVAVGAGLAIALLGTSARQLRILAGGVLAGLGVAAMHYTGMAAMRLYGDIHYSGSRVILSVVIAVVAATVALWLTLVVSRPLIIFISALVMGVAVNGMHFTGMSAMSVTPEGHSGVIEGATAQSMLIPIGITVVFGLLGMAYALASAPNEEDRAATEYLNARIEARMAQQAAQARNATGRGTLGNGAWTYRDRASK